MKRHWWLTVAIAAGITFTVFGFQNCSQDLPSAATNDGGSTSPTGTYTPPPPFYKDDSFDYSRLPNRSQMVQAMLTGYASATGPKAVAITASGLGFVAIPESGTQADASNTALQGCFVISGGQPCVLLAVGDKFNVGSADLNASFTFAMSAPTGINAAAIPFVPAAQATSLASSYAGNGQGAKALVVSVDGGAAVYIYNGMADVSGPGGLPVADANEAERIALERCEWMAKVSPCTTVFKGNTAVFSPTALNRAPKIDYSTPAPAFALPGHTRAHGVQNIDQRWSVRGGNAGAIYLSPEGRWGEDLDPSAATADSVAYSQCVNSSPANNTKWPCVKFADASTSPQIPADLFSKIALAYKNTELHCRAVPRPSCALHAQMGCHGSLYTTSGAASGGTPVLENCP